MVTNYTPEELSKIAEAPIIVGLAVSLVDIGIISSVTESVALSTVLVDGAKKYPANTIIQSILSEEAIKSGSIKLQKPDFKPEDVESGALIDKAITSTTNALALLEGKASPTEILEYKQFIYAAAEAVANAAGSGLFGSGEKISDKEKVALGKIKAALAV
jgi:hypothetical protein